MSKSDVAYRQEYIEQVVRPAMKARKLSGAEMARRIGVLSSQINLILRGDYPHYQAWHWTIYLDDFFRLQMHLPEFTVWKLDQEEAMHK